MTASVSVVVTCYNLERYIAEAIQSVLTQEGVADVEIVVVDDCSTDGSAQIIQSFPVSYIRTATNSGVLLAMLQGIEQAKGDIICFLDGDDLWKPAKLAEVVQAFARDERCALVTHDLEFIDADGRTLERTSRPRQILSSLDVALQPEKVTEGILWLSDYVWLGSALAVRRSVGQVTEFADWAQSLPDPRNTYQDWPLAFWIASLPDVTMGYLPRKLFRYRLHQANYSGDARTPGRAVRNLTRTRNTIDAMLRIAHQRELDKGIRTLIANRKESVEYQILLYQGRRWEALARFPRVAADFRTQGQLAKEALRLVGVLALGPDRFAKWAGQRSVA